MTDQRDDDHTARQEELAQLALGEVTEPRRSELLDHLAGCARCRAGYDEITAAIDATVSAAPTVQPTAGFDLRTLEGIGVVAPTAPGAPGGHRSGAVAGQPDGPRLRSRISSSRMFRSRMAAAAAVALVFAVGAWGVVVAAGGDEQSAPEAGSVGLATTDGEQVGTATVGWLDHRRVLVISVSRPAVGVGYSCRLLRAHAVPTTLGRWEASSQDGGTWVVRTPPGDLTGVQLVADSGQVWASASLP